MLLLLDCLDVAAQVVKVELELLLAHRVRLTIAVLQVLEVVTEGLKHA